MRSTLANRDVEQHGTTDHADDWGLQLNEATPRHVENGHGGGLSALPPYRETYHSSTTTSPDEEGPFGSRHEGPLDDKEPEMEQQRLLSSTDGQKVVIRHSYYYAKTNRRNRLITLGLVLSSAVALLIIVVTLPGSTPTDGRPNQDVDASLVEGVPSHFSYTTEYISNLEEEGWHPLNASRSSPFLPKRRLRRPVPAQQVFDRECSEQWIAHGILCPRIRQGGMEDTEIDVVWTWVAATPHWAAWRDAVARRNREVAKTGGPGRSGVNLATANRRPAGLKAKHFRSHHEFQFSQRSVVAALPSVRRLHLLASDLPMCSSEDKDCQSGAAERVGERPDWLDMAKVSAAEGFVIQHHYDLFKADDGDADAWRGHVLPTFNSLSIESQLSNVADIADTFLYMNDDSYILKPLSPADISTALFGPVFRMQKDLLVRGAEPGNSHQSPDGEWPGLSYSNWLLDRRFGKRPRPYLVHQGKAISAALLDEVASVWAEEMKKTASARFRGNGIEVNTLFLATHYVIERHREALLWSFLVAKMDSSKKGQYSFADRRRLLSTINGNKAKTDSSAITVNRPSRRAQTFEALKSARISLPKSTMYHFTSADGYSLVSSGQDPYRWPSYDNTTDEYDHLPHDICSIPIELCFGSDDFILETFTGDRSSSNLFKRMAFENPQCGDCLIVALLGTSGSTGLNAFLPEEGTSESSKPLTTVPPMLGDLGKEWQAVDYSLQTVLRHEPYSARDVSVRLIQRYSYVMGETPSRFVSLSSINFAHHDLHELQEYRDASDSPVFVALNDDITKESNVPVIDREMQSWHLAMWPNKTKYELDGPIPALTAPLDTTQ